MRRGVWWVGVAIGLGSVGRAAAQVAPTTAEPARVQLLGLNDFHGQLGPAKKLFDRPVGSAAVLASYLRDATARFAGDTLIVHAGDWVGASPPASALLQDEPSVAFLNLLSNPSCTYGNRMHAKCNVVGTAGNHEFDEGASELLRLLRGGKAKRGPFLDNPWRGARYPIVSATVIDTKRGTTLFPPYVVKQVSGVRIGVIGAVLRATPSMVIAGGVDQLRFVDEATAINKAAKLLQKQGIETIVVTIHQGGAQAPYEGPTRPDVAGPTEGIPPILAKLDDAIDVVVSGHAHSFTNALMKNEHGHPILVTQCPNAGVAFASIELTIDRKTRDVISKVASIHATFADTGPGLKPAEDVAALVQRADERVAPLAARVVGEAASALAQTPNADGESALGNLITDAQRVVSKSQVALMNQGGIRTSLDAGPITWGELFAIQPFGNALVSMDLTGSQLLRALEQQWSDPDHAHMLQVSGLRYSYDLGKPVGSRVVRVEVAGVLLVTSASYRVTTNNFLSAGGSGFSVLAEGRNVRVGAIDLDALVAYIEALGKPVVATVEGRIHAVPPAPR
ncbi:MAG: 5-nucleotidase [Pseudomonadota bacterium]|jgi:5'-nucleotidase